MSRYNVEFKPGEHLSKDSAFRLKLTRKKTLTAAQQALIDAGEAIPPETTLEVTLIYPEGMIGGSVQITGPGGFDETITETTAFSGLAAGEYAIQAGAVDNHTSRIFTTPQAVEAETKTCAFVIYDEIGAVGECTPSCSVANDLRWYPLGETPFLIPPEGLSLLERSQLLDAVPDSEFTVDLWSEAETSITFNVDNGGSYAFYARFLGNTCPGDIFNWNTYGNDHHNSAGDYSSFVLGDGFSLGKSLIMDVLVKVHSQEGDRPVPGDSLGYFGVRFQLLHKVDGVWTHVCLPEEINNALGFKLA